MPLSSDSEDIGAMEVICCIIIMVYAICVLSNIYDILTKVLTKRPEKRRNKAQPREQAGIRSRYSTTYHIHVANRLKEKCREYNTPFCIGFIVSYSLSIYLNGFLQTAQTWANAGRPSRLKLGSPLQLTHLLPLP